jgi:glucose-6-phosphate isomerase
LFEIWSGSAIILGQEFDGDDPGRCVAVEASVGQHVVIPPGWAHCVINADVGQHLVFGAFCDRQYGFVYDGVRSHKGMAHFPVVDRDQSIRWSENSNYRQSILSVRKARSYPELGLRDDLPMYRQFIADPDSVRWVSEPARHQHLWSTFEP